MGSQLGVGSEEPQQQLLLLLVVVVVSRVCSWGLAVT